jgi:hypothetical protein
MPAISTIADIVTATLPTFQKGKWDAVGLAQLYPDLEFVKQFVQATKRVTDTSYLIDTSLEIDAPSSFEASYPTHPLQTSTHKLIKRIQTPLVKVRTSMTFSEDEKELQGASEAKILDVVQVRMTKWHRDFLQGVEHSMLTFPSSPTQYPDVLRGVLGYWVTPNSDVTDFSLNGGNDPVGHTAGAGGITKAQEALWPNAVGKFSKVTPDDFFDKIERFLNQVKTQAVVNNPSVASEIPRRVMYVQEPVKRAVSRFMQGSNSDYGNDAGVYRDANMYKDIPITIWHAMSSAQSPVRPATATSMLVDWNAFLYQVLAGYDQKVTGPEMNISVPGQMISVNEHWHALHCTRRDRCMYMTTANTDLTP